MACHEGVTCDGCQVNNFTGIRHKCLVCFDFDLCHTCKINGVTSKGHLTSHPMQTILSPAEAPLYDLYLGMDLGADDGRSSGSDKTYACPFCSQSGLSEMMLADHVGDSHSAESKPVICPICAYKGEPSYVGSDFIAHLAQRHRPDLRDRGRRRVVRRTSTATAGSSKTRQHATMDPLAELLSHFTTTTSLKGKEGACATTHKSATSSKSTAILQAKAPLPISKEPALSDEAQAEAAAQRVVRADFMQDLLISTLLASPPPSP